MKSPAVKALVVALVLAVVGGLAYVLLRGGDGTSASSEATQPCGSLDTPDSGATLPVGLSLPAGQKLLRVQTQGKTKVAFTSTAGGPDDIVRVRDEVLALLKSSGFTVVGTDQEPGFEAEAELTGLVDGTLRVTPLCKDRLEVRYKIEG